MKLVFLFMKCFIFHFIISFYFSYTIKKFQKTKMNTKNKTKFSSLFNLGFLTAKNLKNKKLNSNERYQGFPQVTANPSLDIGQGPLYYQGWNRYFKMDSGTNLQMKEFKINPGYFSEQSAEFQSKYGNQTNLLIPDQRHFYFILTEEYLNTISSKFVKFHNFRTNWQRLWIVSS
jgi:hypothetical protein